MRNQAEPIIIGDLAPLDKRPIARAVPVSRPMRYQVLATDYDGTLATHGQVDAATVEALERLRQHGRRLVLVTGRELDELHAVFPRAELFDRIVAENGALLYRPLDRRQTPLAERPSREFLAALADHGVAPISVGRVIVATCDPHASTVLRVIRDLGLKLQVILNKGAVMILPSGVDKATGLAVALAELGVAPDHVVAVGDAENDLTFLDLCGFAAAVANALPAVKERADLVTSAGHGAGVVELIGRLIGDDPVGDKPGRLPDAGPAVEGAPEPLILPPPSSAPDCSGGSPS
jgi:hydroxymethylpyrimidine pyrophosphatase-like HAD family hydrolase